VTGPDVAALVRDLGAEQGELDRIVAPLTDEQWRRPTPSPGWSVADQVGHLTYFDGAAALAITDPEAFRASAQDLVVDPTRIEEITLHRHLAPAELLARWRENRAGLAAASAALDEDARIEWYGPSMGAKSFVTARLMEAWAHGQDIVDAVGADRPPSDRLRHIAQLGYITRHWSYINRGLEPPADDVRVELAAPSGDIWSWGADDAAAIVRGPASDFCLVVTQRRHIDDTALVTFGAAARDWMLRAQAFAGPATYGPAPATSA
jgi:uncharacterized protein (TIGR03084 family)